jgi:L-iditol 2-dehydrogenase
MFYIEPFSGRKRDLTAHYFSIGRPRFNKNLIFKKFPLCEIKKGFDMYKTPGEVK